LDKIAATVVIAQFGQMESLAGKEKLPAFIAAYEKLLDRWGAGGKRRLVLVSPIQFGQSASALKEKGESEEARQIEKLRSQNETLEDYIDAIRDLAESHQARFVNVSNLDVDDVLVQRDGIHLTSTGQYLMARRWAEGVGA
jgi:lysophospholipase L1-like esterase